MPTTMRRRVVLLLALTVLCGSTLFASTLVQKMDVAEVCSRADMIFRGTVLSAKAGQIEAGGGTLATVTYQIEVTEAFQGDFITKGDQKVAEITMLAPGKDQSVGELKRFAMLADLPTLEVGGDYLLMTSRPSAAGLSAPIGLGQGCYTISGKGEGLTAVNALGEAFSYNELAGAISAALAQ